MFCFLFLNTVEYCRQKYGGMKGEEIGAFFRGAGKTARKVEYLTQLGENSTARF